MITRLPIAPPSKWGAPEEPTSAPWATIEEALAVINHEMKIVVLMTWTESNYWIPKLKDYIIYRNLK
jgi:hypothetical protein